MIKVSVIMAVYNTPKEKILRHSIESIVNQTLQEFELIICDDASDDGTYELLTEISKMDSRIRLYRNLTNMQAAATRNRGISLAKGNYIAIMDADDYSYPTRLQVQYDFLEQNKEYGFVACAANLFDENGNYGIIEYIRFPEKKDFAFVLPFVHASAMFRKEMLAAVEGYRVDRRTRRTEDYDLLMRLYAVNQKGVNLPDKLYAVREDAAAKKRRKYQYRIDEAVIRYLGFKALGILPSSWVFIIKPLIVGLIPDNLLEMLKNLYYKRRK